MADSLDVLDLLLLTETKPRKIQRDGIKFQGLRYIEITLAEYVDESAFTTKVTFYAGQFAVTWQMNLLA